MIVAFDNRPAGEPHGIGRYTSCLLDALKENAPAGARISETHRPSRHDDLFHAPCLDGAMLRSPCPMVVTLHGLLALSRPSEYLRLGARAQLRFLAIQRAVRVIAPTQAVAADASERLGVEQQRITVIPEAPAPAMFKRSELEISAVRAAFGLPERFLLWVGNLRRHQPRRHLLQLAAAKRRLPLVLVGPTRPWVHELPGVIVTGQVNDDQLAAIYTAAHCLLMSGEDEGFGLPTVEALACGTPVAAFDQPALREVLADRASFVATGDVQGLVEAAELSLRPAPAPPIWSWADAAEQTWRVYASALAEAQTGETRAICGRRSTAGRVHAGAGAGV